MASLTHRRTSAISPRTSLERNAQQPTFTTATGASHDTTLLKTLDPWVSPSSSATGKMETSTRKHLYNDLAVIHEPNSPLLSWCTERRTPLETYYQGLSSSNWRLTSFIMYPVLLILVLFGETQCGSQAGVCFVQYPRSLLFWIMNNFIFISYSFQT